MIYGKDFIFLIKTESYYLLGRTVDLTDTNELLNIKYVQWVSRAYTS